MKYDVMFSVKNVEKSDPNYGYLIDRVKHFPNIRSALNFSKTIRNHISGKEQLIGKPLIRDAA